MGDAHAVVNAVLSTLGLPPAHAVKRQQGYDAIVNRADLTDGRTVAMRQLRPGAPPDRELQALRTAVQHGHPAPAVIATGQHGGRAVIVTAWCSGRTIGDLLVAGGTPDHLGRLFGRAHADLHRPIDRGQVLCHLDFQPFNILVDGDEVTGIVDWPNAHVGDRREDLAWTRAVLALAPALLPDFADGIDDFTAAWRSGYAERRPMPSDADLAPFLVTAAQRQLSNWAPRVAAGECPAAVGDAAQALVTAWTE